MKHFITVFTAVFLLLFPAGAQTQSRTDADAIVGSYEATQEGDAFKVRITRKPDGTYKAQIYWVRDAVNPATGKKYLDAKNPDKSLRSVPCDEIVLIDGLKYNAAKHQWDGAKIYDPQRGIRAAAVVKFTSDGRLSVRGSLLGISETVYWTPL